LRSAPASYCLITGNLSSLFLSVTPRLGETVKSVMTNAGLKIVSLKVNLVRGASLKTTFQPKLSLHNYYT
jgi:hypothetical protein